MLDSKNKVENLMNLVMQFRKVCNHPDLFERKTIKSPLMFNQYKQDSPTPFFGYKELFANAGNPIEFFLPNLVFDEIIQDDYKMMVIEKKFSITESILAS